MHGTGEWQAHLAEERLLHGWHGPAGGPRAPQLLCLRPRHHVVQVSAAHAVQALQHPANPW